MDRKFIVSIHIPKTAGTTLAQIFDRVFKRRVIYDYDGYSAPMTPNADIVNNKEFVQSYFDVLHGHFYATKYAGVFPGAATIATLRHPVDRVISQYMHELNENSSDAFFHEAIVNGRMDIVDFAEQKGIGDAMSRHLAGRDLRDYDALLLSERLWESCEVLSHKVRPLGLGNHFGTSLPRLNTGQRQLKLEIPQEVKVEIFKRTALDNEVYRIASEILDKNLASIQGR